MPYVADGEGKSQLKKSSRNLLLLGVGMKLKSHFPFLGYWVLIACFQQLLGVWGREEENGEGCLVGYGEDSKRGLGRRSEGIFHVPPHPGGYSDTWLNDIENKCYSILIHTC